MLSGDGVFRIIGKVLDGCALRQKVLAANLANVETPGYKRLEVRFDEQLAKAVESGRPDRLDRVEFEIGPTQGLAARGDGNNVDFGRELGEMSKNNLAFSTFAQLAALRVRRYRDAIGG